MIKTTKIKVTNVMLGKYLEFKFIIITGVIILNI